MFLNEIIKKYFKENWLAILMAVLVGLIYVIPNVVFVLSLGNEYQGIPMMGASDTDFYLTRIQEILDGHPSVGSPVFWEYKDWPALSPPVGEFFYALPSKLFNTSPVNIMVINRFIFSFVLFLLIYSLIKRLTDKSFLTKINAIAGGLFVLLGYDFIDYRTMWNFFASGMPSSVFGRFLIWARPVNPIMGGIFLFAFLICILAIFQKTKYQKIAIGGAAVFLALMFGNYFFSWGMALSIWFVLLLIYLIKRDYQLAKKLFLVILVGLIISSPYWFASWQASRGSLYHNSVLRDGLFITHYPLLNKLTLSVLAVFLLIVGLPILKQLRFGNGWRESLKMEFEKMADWQWFCLAFILGSLIAYSQQIVTGLTIWPYHFAQYSIPLMIIVLVVLFCNIIRKKLPKIWRLGVFVLIGVLLPWGIFNQARAYNSSYLFYKNLQSYSPVFNWLNGQPKDSVVLVVKDREDGMGLNNLVPAFTHCNVYTSSWTYSIMPEERRLHNYLVFLRIKGLSSDDIEKYLKDHRDEAADLLFSNWKGLFKVKDFPDFSDQLLEQRLNKLPQDYKDFLKNDFEEELEKYRIDFILSVGPLSQNIQRDLPGTIEVFRSGDLFVYKF